MQSLKDRLIGNVITREKGFSDHPADRGGPTKDGITEAVARRHGYTGDMRELPDNKIREIYAADYWHSLHLDRIAAIHSDLTEYLFDYGVNSGPERAAEALQRLLNVLNRVELDYQDIAVDGAVGPQTLAALEDFRRERGWLGLNVLAEAVNGLRVAFLVELSEARESQEAFTFGWLKRVILMSQEARE
nr:glycosyl hydrolase 108 family protein [uncultured Halomonas sp.]